jgi:hypothetical protein
VGHWTYRSFLNRAEHDDDINNLLFGDAELIFERTSLGEVKGALNLGDAGSLTLKGAVAYGNPFSIRFSRGGRGSRESVGRMGFRDHYVGSISLFALQHAAAGHGSTSVKLRLTSVLQLEASGDEAASRVSISLIPELAPSASAPKTPFC